MPYLYLIELSSFENVALLSSKKTKLNKGNKFSRKNINSTILSIKELEIDFLKFLNITKKIFNNSFIEIHSLRNQVFLSIDNNIWIIGFVPEENLIIYNKVFIEI